VKAGKQILCAPTGLSRHETVVYSAGWRANTRLFPLKHDASQFFNGQPRLAIQCERAIMMLLVVPARGNPEQHNERSDSRLRGNDVSEAREEARPGATIFSTDPQTR
jgi:hypothetical protein